MRFNNKVVIVTGGSSGTGKAAVLEFLKEGASVVIASRGKEKAKETLDEFNDFEERLAFFRTDISDEESIKSMFGKTVGKFGKLDILVNNRGSFKNTFFERATH